MVKYQQKGIMEAFPSKPINMKAKIIWFLFALMWNIETLFSLLKNTFSFSFFSCLISILGFIILIYQTIVLIKAFTNKKKGLKYNPFFLMLKYIFTIFGSCSYVFYYTKITEIL